MFRRLRRTRILRERLLVEDTWSSLLSEHPILSGLSSEELSRLRYVAEMTGLGFDALTSGLFRLGISAAEAIDPMSRQAQAWDGALPMVALHNWRTAKSI